MNLLQETLEVLSENGKTVQDVEWVILDNKKTTWNNFFKIADFSYDSGFGCNEISLALKIIGKDWWLERGEYDGSEWWSFKKVPFFELPEMEFLKKDILCDFCYEGY
jgi:hypothetical protein